MGVLEFIHQILVADIVNEVIFGTDITSVYGFIVDLRQNVLIIGQEKIKFSTAEIIGSTKHLIKQMMVAKIGVNRHRKRNP